MTLSKEQIGNIEDVIYCLRHGTMMDWINPAASLDACIKVLQETKELFPIEEPK